MSMSSTDANKDISDLAKQLWALGDPVRLQILRLLPAGPTCHNACNVSKIAEQIGLSQPATSHHLRILRQAGVISNQKKCRDMIYWIDQEAASAVNAQLKEVLG